MTMPLVTKSRVLVYGASSGLGLALAKHYAQQGHEVAIAARDFAKTAHDLVAMKLTKYPLNISDAHAVSQAFHDFAQGEADLIIVCAGTYYQNRSTPLSDQQSMEMLATHIAGAQHVFACATQHWLAQSKLQSASATSLANKHLVLIGTIAVLLRQDHKATLYAASKRAAVAIADSYRPALAAIGVPVTVVLPGYVDTAKLRSLNGGNAQQKPFLYSEARAVQKISRAISKRVDRLIFPWQLRLLITLYNCLPAVLAKWFR